MDTQTIILKNMSGEERLEQACILSDFIRELALLNIQKQYPKLSHKQQIEKLRDRIQTGHYHGTT